jgi:two-component system, NarL family, response regulator DesR
MISVLLAGDQGLMRSSLVTLLSLEPDFEVDAVADGTGALQRLRGGGYAVALLDIQLPGLSGLDIIRAVRDEHLDVRCVVVTTFPRPGYVRRAMDDGARGFLVKDRPVEELASAIRAVAAGQVVLDDCARRATARRSVR